MVAESGQVWLASRSRLYGQNPILVAFDDDIAVEIKYLAGEWRFTERRLSRNEVTELNSFAQSHRHMFKYYNGATERPRTGSIIIGDHFYLRAWAKNGRMPDWNVSIVEFKISYAVMS
jgi:hypothetical protein